MTRALVTGGGGFLGGAIARALLERGWEVVSVARGDYPHLRELGVVTQRGDLAEPGVAQAAVEGCDVVFHVAAKAGVWGRYDDYHRSNVAATEQLLSASQRADVSRFVYTSTPSVIHAGGDIEGVDESTPYPQHFETHYPKTKAEAEQMVLAAHNQRGVSTVALRPHLIWGPGDTQFMPRIIDRAKSGRLRLVGDGQKLIDTVYIDNAVSAHLLAADKLGPDAACGGKAYFITQGEPIPTADMVNRLLNAAGLPPVERRVPFALAYAVGAMLEGAYTLFGVQSEPPLTRFVAQQLATAHWYDIGAARRDLSYQPLVSLDEGMRRLADSLRTQPKPPPG